MSAVTPTTPASDAALPANTLSPPATAGPPSLLVDPVPGVLADPLSMLYLLESKDQQLSVDEGTKKIGALQAERHEALQQEQQAIQQAAEAASHRSFWDGLGSIFGEVAKVAAVVASIAAAVVTCGAATPIAAIAIAGAVLSTASFADGELHVLRTLGVDETTARWVDLGIGVGGAVLSCGAGVAAGAQAASSTLSSFRTATTVVGIAGQMASGALAIPAGEARAQRDQAAADEVAAQALSDHARRLMQTVINDTQSSVQQSQQLMGTIVSTKTIQAETALTAATAVRG